LIVNPADNFLTPLTHSRRGKAREHNNGLLRLLVFSSFCSGIPAAGKKGIPIAEILLIDLDLDLD
jgi:hypothetical protein